MVFVMKPAQHRYRNHSAVHGNAVSTGSLSDTIRQPIWNARPEAGVRAGVIVVTHPFEKNPTKVPLIQRNDPIQILSADRSD